MTNLFFWCALRWTLESDVLDAEAAIEGAEEIIAVHTSTNAAREELCALIREVRATGV